MIVDLQKYLDKGYLKIRDGEIEWGYDLNPETPQKIAKEIFELDEQNYKILGVHFLFFEEK